MSYKKILQLSTFFLFATAFCPKTEDSPITNSSFGKSFLGVPFDENYFVASTDYPSPSLASTVPQRRVDSAATPTPTPIFVCPINQWLYSQHRNAFSPEEQTSLDKKFKHEEVDENLEFSLEELKKVAINQIFLDKLFGQHAVIYDVQINAIKIFAEIADELNLSKLNFSARLLSSRYLQNFLYGPWHNDSGIIFDINEFNIHERITLIAAGYAWLTKTIHFLDLKNARINVYSFIQLLAADLPRLKITTDFVRAIHLINN